MLLSKITTIIVVHFVPSTLVVDRLPLAFLFSHLVFFAVGLWTLHDRKSLLPVVVVSVHRQKRKGGVPCAFHPPHCQNHHFSVLSFCCASS